MHGNRDDFSAKTKELLAKRVGCRCSNPFCRTLTCGAGDPADAVVNIGVAAHICAAAPGGKRYDPEMTRENRRHIDNGIWLCQSCAKLIDSDEQRYTVQLLYDWKSRAEREAIRELERAQNKTQEAGAGFLERIQKLSVAIRKCDNYESVMECIVGLQTEMDALVERMEILQDKVDLAKSNRDSKWEQIYETQFGYTLSLFEQLSYESQEMHQQAYYLRNHAESLTQNAPGGELPVQIVIDVSGSMNSTHCVPFVDSVVVERAAELLQWLLDSWRRAAILEVELDKLLFTRHQYELMTLDLLEALSD